MAHIGLSVLAAIVVIFIFKYIFQYFKHLKFNSLVHSPGVPYPLIGHSHIFHNVPPEDVLEVFLSYIRKDPEKRKMHVLLGTNTLVWFYHPDCAEKILSSNVHITKSREYVFLEPWLGTGLLMSTHEKWRHRRKLLTPAFHFRILEDSLKVLNRQADTCAKVLLEDSHQGKSEINLFPYMTRCTLDIILETAMGRTLDTQNNKDSKYAHAIQTMIHIVQQRQMIPWLMPDLLFNWSHLKKDYDSSLEILHSFTKGVIKSKREEFAGHEINKTSAIGPVAFLDLLMTVRLPDGSQLSDSDVAEEVDTFMFEGHDTTACALSWALLLLGNHPEIQDRLYEEQVEIFGDDADAHVTQEHMKEMKYLEACIKEALRLFPSVPFFAREIEQDEVIDGLTIPKGSTVGVLVHMLHRNPLIWENPELFDPDRFMDQAESRHPFAYVPFSAGPRNCIGQKFALMEEKTVLSKLVRKFKFESLDPVEKVKPVIEIITRPYNGIRARLIPRT